MILYIGLNFNRGSCHIHALLWIENAPDYAKVKAEKIEAFVDQYISCSEDVPQEHADYLDIQKHKHSRTFGDRRVMHYIRFGSWFAL